MINANLNNCILNLSVLNLLYNIKAMPLINMDRAWWASYFAEGATYENKLYYTAGMVSGGGYFATPYVMVCNTDLQRDVYLEDGSQMDILSLVDDGRWTISVMMDIITDYYGAPDGPGGEFNPREDFMIYAHNRDSKTASAHFIAGNGKFSSIDEDGWLDVYSTLTSFQTQYLVKGLQTVFSAMPDNYDQDYFYNEGGQIEAFLEKRALFIGNFVNEITGIVDQDVNYAIIPCPKSNNPVQTEYFSGVNTWTAGFTAYAGNLSDAEFVAYASETLGWLSYRKVRPEIYDVTLCLRLVRDDERQITIMDEIFENLYVDLNYLHDFGGSKTKLANTIFTSDNYFTAISKLERGINRDVSSFIAGMEAED